MHPFSDFYNFWAELHKKAWKTGFAFQRGKGDHLKQKIMKKQWLLSLIFTFICGVIYGQNLIRVNNNPAADPDYLTLQEANDNASNGDTIYVEGSATTYSGADISKSLTIIGPGFFLSENDSTQANGLEANIYGQINFNAGSTGSVITGIKVSSVFINVDDIVISRCYIGATIYFSSNIDNILILQNYVGGSIQTSGGGIITNGIISNNIFNNNISISSTSGPLQVVNNVLFGSYSYISVYNSSIANNILSNTNNIINENTGNTITNNLLARDGTNANGNQYNVVMANVFVDFNGNLGYSTDGKWQLKPGSPAIGAGVSGVDCGVFGGTSPYVLSGLPAVPRIYEASIAGTAYSDQGLQCTIKIKSGQ